MSVSFYDLFERPSPERREGATVTPIDPERASRYARKALTSECENVIAAPEGQRNHTLNKAAFSIAQLVAAGHVDETDARSALTYAARSAGLTEDEIEGTIDSGFEAGSLKPRVVADLPPVPDPTVLRDPGETENGIDPLGRFNLIDWPTLKRAEDTGEEWLVEPLIAAGRMVALYSAPKAGKSLLVLEIVAALALGLPTLGHVAQRPRKVLYVDFENDPRGDIKPRLEDMGHDLDDLDGHLYVATFPSIAKLDTAQGGVDLLWAAQKVEAELVVIDTVSRTVGGEENDNNTWLSFYRNTGVPLKREGIACLRLDHSGKDRERGMRGGSAKYGDVDAVWRLVAVSETVIELDCTDHRMPLDTIAFTVVRRTDPLRHEVSGEPFMVAMDARERTLLDTLDRLEVPIEWGRDRVRAALAEAGIKAQNTLISRVLKARKVTVLPPVPDRSRTGADSQPVDRLSGTPCKGPDGGQVGAVPQRTGQVDSRDELQDDLLVGCKSCFHPTTAPVADANGGLCAGCFRDTGQTHHNPAAPAVDHERQETR